MNEAKAQALVVSGFLGSGKTTLVRSLLEQGQREGIRTAVVSNEFGELGIDEALLASSGGDFVELAGGCVCCRLSDDLLRTLEELWQKARPERVIVETSGLALPYDTLINFWRDPVRTWAIDESSVVVVSAEQLAEGRDLDAVFEDQVCSADLLLLSKTDLVSPAAAGDARRDLEAMQPDTPVLVASFGEVDARVFFPPGPGSRGGTPRREGGPVASGHARPDGRGHGHGRGNADPAGGGNAGHAHDHDRFRSEELSFPAGIALAEVEKALAARAPLRAKGFVQAAEGLRLVQGVAGRLEFTEPASPPPPHLVGRVVVIERRDP